MPVIIVPRSPAPAVEHPQTPQQPTHPQRCSDCNSPLDLTPLDIDPGSREWKKGDIVVLNESIHAPIDDILGNRRSRSQHWSTATSSSGGSRRGKNRSAIVWEAIPGIPAIGKAPPTPAKTFYILMASYEGCHRYDQLPAILKDHFVLCVSPHGEIRPGDSHVHTTPEWQVHYIWLVARPFASDGQVPYRWRWKNSENVWEEDKGFRIAGDALSQLQRTMGARIEKWNSTCLDRPGDMKQFRKEYDIFRNPEAWARHLAERAQKDTEKADSKAPAAEDVTVTLTKANNGALGVDPAAGSDTQLLGARSPLPPSEPTLVGSSLGASNKDSTSTPASHSPVDTAQGNGDTAVADEGADEWKVAGSTRKKSSTNKLKKNPERQRTTSGLGSRIAGWVGGTKGREVQSHR